MKGRFLSFHFSTFHTGCRKVAPSVEQRRERMPSWLWTDVIVTGESAEAVEEFVRGELHIICARGPARRSRIRWICVQR